MRTSAWILLSLLAGCTGAIAPAADAGPSDGGGASDGGVPTTEWRVADQAIVAFLSSSPDEPWWLEERLAPQPAVPGDRDLGPRAIVRAAPGRQVVWSPGSDERLTAACRHPSGEWSAVGVGSDRRVFLARGDADGLVDRRWLDDPALAEDSRAWTDTARDVPRIAALTEASPSVAADGEDVVITLATEDHAVLAYRWRRTDGAWTRGPRTLVSPATPVTPYLPIGGSYDDWDAIVAPYLPRLAVDAEGHAFVAILVDRTRLARHDAVMGTSHDLLREVLYPRENTLDALVSRIDRDGSITFSLVAGTVDYEDEIFGIAAGDDHVAVLGRRRRELGRDNTELHAIALEIASDGSGFSLATFDGDANAIALGAAYVGGDLFVGGTEGWAINPSGRSVLSPGRPFLVRVHDGATPGSRVAERVSGLVPATSGHAELRALLATEGALLLGGHENGPLTHTGDADPSLVRSDAFAARVTAP